MQIKNYFKGLKDAVLNKSFNSGSMPLGLVWALQNVGFTWNINYENNYRNKIVYAVETLIVKKLIEVPVTVSKIVNQKSFRKLNKSINPEQVQAFKEISLDEIPDHPINILLQNPNDYQSRIEFMEAFWYNYNLGKYGGMIWAETAGDDARPSRAGKPVQLHVLPSNQIYVDRSNDFRAPIKSIIYTTREGQTINLDPANVMQLRRWHPQSDILSFSPQEVASQLIAKNDANSIAQGSAFVNGGTGILLSSDAAINSQTGSLEDKMSIEQMALLKENITKDIKGAYNNKNVNFTNGYVNVQKLGDTLADLELIEAAKSDWKEYASMRGVHPVLVGSESAATESNVTTAYKVLVTNYVIPDLRKFDEKFTSFLFSFYGEKDIVSFHDITEFSELTPDYEVMKRTFGTPLLTVDETRKIFNYDAFGGDKGDAILVGSNFQTLDDLISADTTGKEMQTFLNQ
jgi:phage portal protein BeeE